MWWKLLEANKTIKAYTDFYIMFHTSIVNCKLLSFKKLTRFIHQIDDIIESDKIKGVLCVPSEGVCCRETCIIDSDK